MSIRSLTLVFALAAAIAVVASTATPRAEASRAGQQTSQPVRAGGPTPTIEDRTNGLRKIDGFFPLYWDERAGMMLLEIPRFDSEFLFSTGLSAGLGSNDIGLDRGAGGQGRVVTFQRSRGPFCGGSPWRPSQAGGCWWTRRRSSCVTSRAPPAR
jgi:hypothetical protein